ncbi:MAG: COX15/CtaA family protein [Ilumatobacteraceae bacterium]
MQISPPRYRTITIGALVALAVIIVTGAAVRLTGSGLGCDDWPNCSGERLIDVSSKHAAIEQINRLFTGVVVVAVIAAVLGSYRRAGPRRTDLIRLSWALVAGVVANAVLGGISVLVDLHPLAVQGHLILSMALIVTGTVLVRRAGEPDGAERRVVVSHTARRLTWIVFALTTCAIFTGTLVTGAGPHAGDENAERLDLDIEWVARIHGSTVMIAIAMTLLIAWRLRSHPDDATLAGPVSTWLFAGVLQAAIGYVQYFNDVPELLVGAHVAGATVVTWATTQLVFGTTQARSGPHADVASTDAVVTAPVRADLAGGYPRNVIQWRAE